MPKFFQGWDETQHHQTDQAEFGLRVLLRYLYLSPEARWVLVISSLAPGQCLLHSNHLGTPLEEGASGLYPSLLAGARLDPNRSLQREMVQECVKRQGAGDRETEGGERRWWGGLERCETGMM